MAVTLWNFFLTYVRPERGIFTVQYPEERLEEKERFRNFPFLVYDGTPDNIRCVACDICAKECPPKCIYIVPEKDAQGRILKKPAQFDIDFAICMNCGICEEVCPFDAIYMNHEFELSEYNRQEDLMYPKEKLLKPWEHFQKIRPTDFAQIEEKRAQKGVKGRQTTPAGSPMSAGKTQVPGDLPQSARGEKGSSPGGVSGTPPTGSNPPPKTPSPDGVS